LTSKLESIDKGEFAEKMSTAIKQSLSTQTLLLLDASTSIVQAGILRDGNWLAFYEDKNESLNAIFKNTAKCLKEAQSDISAIDGFLICEGPGSVLGLRQIIMAVKTWRSILYPRLSRVYIYRSLEVAAQLLLIQDIEPPFHVISDFRKDSWNLLTVKKDRSIRNMEQVNTQSLNKLSDPLWYIPQRKKKYPPPLQVNEINYSLKTLPELLSLQSFFHEVDDMNEINPGKSEFAKWQIQRHRKIT